MKRGRSCDPAFTLEFVRTERQWAWEMVARSRRRDSTAVPEVEAVTLTRASRWVVCRFEIAQGDPSRVPELLRILTVYGTPEIAVDFLNSGQPQLHEAGVAWARSHGYRVLPNPGANAVGWGGGNTGLPTSK